jgi:hypothetical protein
MAERFRFIGTTKNGVRLQPYMNLTLPEFPSPPKGTALLAFGTIPLYEIGQEVNGWRITDTIETQNAFFFYGVPVQEPPQWVKDLQE